MKFSVEMGGLFAVAVVAVMFTLAARVGAPWPISGLILVLMLSGRPLIGIPVVAVLLAGCYFGWLRPISRGKLGFTVLTWAAIGTLAILSAVWYWQGWPHGMKWHGGVYTAGCAVISAFL